MLHITGRTEPKLRQKTVFCFTLILLIGNILNTNYQNSATYQNSPNHPYHFTVLYQRFQVFRLFRQVIGIPMGTNCAPLLADLFLYSYENEFLDNMIRSGHRRLARSFNLCYRYIDDLIVFNNKKFLDYLKEIYPSQLTVEKANKSDHLADYLDLTFIIDSGGKLSTRLYDKRDDFDFHIVNFPYLSSNIPSGPSYGVNISQLIRYARCCSHYDDFRYRHKCLVDRLLSQGYMALRLEKSFKKFYGRYQDRIEKYQRSVNVMVNDSFPG